MFGIHIFNIPDHLSRIEAKKFNEILTILKCNFLNKIHKFSILTDP